MPGPSSSTVTTTARRAGTIDPHGGDRVPASVLDQRREDPLDKSLLDRDPDARGRDDRRRSGARTRTPAAAPRAPPPGVAGRAVRVELGPGGGDQRVERAAHLPALSSTCSSARRPSSCCRVAQRELGLGGDARQRRAQLVRELGREPLLVAEARREAVEQPVERGRRAASARRGAGRARTAGRGRGRSIGGLAGHLRDRPQRPGDQPPARRPRPRCSATSARIAEATSAVRRVWSYGASDTPATTVPTPAAGSARPGASTAACASRDVERSPVATSASASRQAFVAGRGAGRSSVPGAREDPDLGVGAASSGASGSAIAPSGPQRARARPRRVPARRRWRRCRGGARARG